MQSSKNMKILFIIPPENKPRKLFFSPKIGIYIPLGIAQIAAMLEKRNHKVKALDLRLCDEECLLAIKKTLSSFKPDIIGMSCSFFSAKITFEIARSIKEVYDAPIILGGPYATVFATSIMRSHKSIEIIVVDEGDYTFPEILDSMGKKQSLSLVKGILYREGKKIVRTQARPVISDLNDLPFPAFHLFDFKKYVPLPKHCKRTPLLPMITSRGCQWGKCTFCYQPRIYGRRLSPERVVNEIAYFKKIYNIREVRFWDDIFISNRTWINKFCDLLEKEDLGIIWSCHARVDMVSKEILERIAKAGCWQILYGIESESMELLGKIGKGITKEQAINAVRWTKESKIEARISCIIGLPDETPVMTDRTIEFAYSLDADLTQFSLATPYPGTRMYERYRHSKRLDKDLTYYSEIKAVYLPKGYDNKKQLEDKFKMAYRRYYFRPSYILKNLVKIRELDDIKRFYYGIRVALGMSA